MGATAYASTSGALGVSGADALTRSGLPQAPATADTTADAAAKAALVKRAATARSGVNAGLAAERARISAVAAANSRAAGTSIAAVRKAAAAKKAAAKKAAAARKAAAAKKTAVQKAPATTAAPATSDAPVVTGGSPRAIAAGMLSSYGWSSGQMSCLNSLWTKESGWQVNADNPSSSAYGIPQSLPGSKMASAGADWRTNPATQIKWGLTYIKGVYGSPCAAWGHSQATNWY